MEKYWEWNNNNVSFLLFYGAVELQFINWFVTSTAATIVVFVMLIASFYVYMKVKNVYIYYVFRKDSFTYWYYDMVEVPVRDVVYLLSKVVINKIPIYL